MTRTYKDKTLQKNYNACRAAARNPSSEFFMDGKPRWRGAAHREAYWKGRAAVKNRLWPGKSIAAACYAAGVDDRQELGPITLPINRSDS